MNSKDYLKWIEANKPSRISTTKWGVKAFSQAGIDMAFFLYASDKQIIKSIMDTGVSSINDITSLISVVKDYMKENGIPRVFNISPKKIYVEIQNCDTGVNNKRFIDPASFNALIYRIKNTTTAFDAAKGTNNDLWYATLLEALWSGVYSNNLSAVYNLRVSDIRGDFLSVSPDDAPAYELYCDQAVLTDLIKTSEIKTWFRKPITVPIVGQFDDSVFKFERRTEDKINFRHTYSRRLRNISNDYLEFSLSPKNLYISGLVYRIINRLMNQESLGFSSYKECLDYVFGISTSTIKMQAFIKDIINDELAKSGYNKTFYILKKNISGNLSDFIPDQSSNPAWLK